MFDKNGIIKSMMHSTKKVNSFVRRKLWQTAGG